MQTIFVKLTAAMLLFALLVSCAGPETPPALPGLPTETLSPTETLTLIPSATRTPKPTATASITPTFTPHPAISFAEPILAFIEGRYPDYQDDFSSQSSGWEILPEMQNGSCCLGSARYQDREYAVIANAHNAQQEDDFNWAWGGFYTKWPKFSNYALEIEQRWAGGSGLTAFYLCGADHDCLNLRFWSPQVRFDFLEESLYPERPMLHHLVGFEAPWLTDLREPTRMLLLKKGNEAAIYLNQRPVYYLQLSKQVDYELYYLQLRVGNNSASEAIEVHWDNLKVWVLEP